MCVCVCAFAVRTCIVLNDDCFFVIAGGGGREVGAADGRELWVLGNVWQVSGVKQWLMEEGICSGTIGAAAEYGVSAGGGCEELVKACGEAARRDGMLGSVSVDGLRGVGAGGARPNRHICSMELTQTNAVTYTASAPHYRCAHLYAVFGNYMYRIGI